jgi:hypothetical protein
VILTHENYYTPEANKIYMSVSQLKDFYTCEAMAMAKINGAWEMKQTTALLVGSYVDAYFDGSLPLFIAQHPEITKKDGCLKADYEQANQIISRIESDRLMMEYLSGEKQVIMTGDLFGCKWKIKIDSKLPFMTVDLKVMRSLEPVMGKSFIEHWLYDVQMSVYQHIRGERLPAYLAVATKEEYTDLAVISIPQWRLDECLQWVGKQVPRIQNVKSGNQPAERCEVCDYCHATKVLTSPINFEDVGLSTKILKQMRGEY